MGNKCTLYNDTKYPVRLKDYDSNRMLYPGDRQGNWLAKGADYYIDLVMQFPKGEVTRSLRGCEFNNETKYMSNIFRDKIEEQERKERERKQKAATEKSVQDMLHNDVSITDTEACSHL